MDTCAVKRRVSPALTVDLDVRIPSIIESYVYLRSLAIVLRLDPNPVGATQQLESLDAPLTFGALRDLRPGSEVSICAIIETRQAHLYGGAAHRVWHGVSGLESLESLSRFVQIRSASEDDCHPSGGVPCMHGRFL